MASAKSAFRKPAENIVDATAKTRSLIESLQARLDSRVQSSTVGESIEDLERQLQACFDRATPENEATAWSDQSRLLGPSLLLDDLKNRVIEGVVDRILAEWSASTAGVAESPLRKEVLNRLVDRLFEEFRKSERTGEAS